MTDVCTNQGLIAVAARQGMDLSIVEAAIVLGYLEGHDFMLLRDSCYHTKLHDLQFGDDHSEDEDYTIRDAIEFCVEMNEELLLEAQTGGDPEGREAIDLGKDACILEQMMHRAEKVVPPVIREYKVAIVETLKKVVRVRAASWAEAEEFVGTAWKEGDYVLTADDFTGVRIISEV